MTIYNTPEWRELHDRIPTSDDPMWEAIRAASRKLFELYAATTYVPFERVWVLTMQERIGTAKAIMAIAEQADHAMRGILDEMKARAEADPTIKMICAKHSSSSAERQEG